MNFSNDPVLGDVVSMLSGVVGVCAVGLGGSRSLGIADQNSDYDIVVFQQRRDDIDSAALTSAIERISESPPRVTGKLALAEFTVRGRKIELLFRRLDTIAAEIEAARQGRFNRVIHPLHPGGFLSTVMVSYLTYVLPVWDPEGLLARLNETARPYPDLLRQRMIATFRNEAGLGLIHASKVRRADEPAYLLGLYSRVVSAWLLVLFALNRRYPVIDKGAIRLIMSFPEHPVNFQGRVARILSDGAAGNLQRARAEAWQLQREVVTMTGGKVGPHAEPRRPPAAPAVAPAPKA